MSKLLMGFGGGEPFEVDGTVSEFQLVWEPADGSLPAIPGGVLRVDPVEVSFEASPEFVARFVAAVEAHEGHRAGWRLDWDGVHRCPECEPLPPRAAKVYRVLPGCWEAWCRRCAFLTDMGLVAQVGSWERALMRAGEHLREVHGVVLRAADPGPPAGSRVRDDCGTVWVNDGYRPACWVHPDLVAEGVHDPETWTKIAGNCGPVTVLEWGETDE